MKVDTEQVALEILYVLAYLAPDKIPIDEIFSKRIDDEDERHSALKLLHRYCMINLEGDNVNINRLVQQVIRIQLKEENMEEMV